MSLLEWKKLAKQKTELGNNINFVHDTILKNQLGEKTSQESLQKVFKPITTKLDDVAFRNLNIPRLKKRGRNRGVPDYAVGVEDEDGGIPDYGLDDFFDEGLVPENKKQIVPKPPMYKESLKDVLEGKKQIYVDPQYFPEEPQDLPPEYEEDEEIDYALDEEDSDNMILDDLGLSNYDDIEKQLNQPEMTPRKTKRYIDIKLKDAIKVRNQLKGRKSQASQAYNKGNLNEAEKTLVFKILDNERVVVNQYIKHYENKVKTMEGSGLKKRGGNIVFFNDAKQLLKKLELIVGEMLAGNTSIEMRNTGVAILDMLLKTSKINKAQHEKLYKTYFKI